MQLAQHRHVAPALLSQVAALRAYLELAQGQLQAASHWLEASGLSATDAPSYPLEQEYLTLARVRIAEARATQTGPGLLAVLGLLDRLLAQAEANRRMHSVLEILLVRALALEVQGDRTAALATLARTLTLGESEGYVRLFLDEGLATVALLSEAQRHGLAPGYSAKLLEAVSEPGAGDVAVLTPTASSLVEPLTEREHEVLQLLADGASNREIAHRLILSIGTVKKYVYNICSKLSVQSRTRALARARALHLL